MPVAHPYHLCEDRDVIGSLFYVMSYEDGRIFWDPALPELPKADRAACYDALLQTMAALHDIDVDAVGLADYGRPGNYFERQIGVWTKQYRAAETERLDAMETLIDWLPQACPEDTGRPTLVHGDFRIDNLMFARDSYRVQAVLDWELSTLGNPLADLAYLCMCLRLPSGGQVRARGDRAELGVPDEAAIVARYCELRGIEPIRDWHFYLAFSFFRLASIAQGVKARAAGQCVERAGAARRRDGRAARRAGRRRDRRASLKRPVSPGSGRTPHQWRSTATWQRICST